MHTMTDEQLKTMVEIGGNRGLNAKRILDNRSSKKVVNKTSTRVKKKTVKPTTENVEAGNG